MNPTDLIISGIAAVGGYYVSQGNIVFAVMIFLLSYILYTMKVGLLLTIVLALVIAFILAGNFGHPVNLGIAGPININMPQMNLPNATSITLPQLVTNTTATTSTNAPFQSTTTMPAAGDSTTTSTIQCNYQCCSNNDCAIYEGDFAYCCYSNACSRCQCYTDADCKLGYHCSANYCAYGT